MTTWGVYIDWARDDDFDDAIDSIWSDVVSLKWRLGMQHPYRSVADESTCIIDVRNTDGKYNPENSSSPLYGLMLPQRPVKITATDGVETRVMWRGWVARIEPKWTPAGTYTGLTLATIHCIGAKDLLQSAEINLPLQQNKRGDEIIAEVLRRVVLPPAVSGGWLLGKVGYSELGLSSYLASDSDYSDLETGRLSFRYYGDVRGEVSEESTDGYRIIRDVTDAERGRFFFDREGKAVWWNQDHLLDDVVDDAVVDSGGSLGIRPARLQYAYGASVANHVQVRAYPRAAGSTITLWSLDNDMTVPAGGSIGFEAPFTDDKRRRAGALDASAANVTFSAGTADVSLDVRAERAIVTLSNSGSVDAILTGMDIEGQVLTAHNQVIIEQEDADSILNYGRREAMKLTLRALDDLNEAIDIAQFELERLKDPRGEVASLSFINAADGSANAEQLEWTIGTRLRVVADELSHDQSYFIIGEQHQVSAGGGVHETLFMLEPAIFDRVSYYAKQNLNTGTALQDADEKTYLSQGFKVAHDCDIDRIRLRLKKVGSPDGSLTLKLFSDKVYSGTWELGEAGASELGVTTKLLPMGETSVPYDRDMEATAVLDGAVSVSTTFTHTSDCEIWYTLDTLPSASGIELRFRRQDGSNYLAVICNSAGNFTLYEVVSGSYTPRGSAAGVLSGGESIRIVCDGKSITGFYDGTQAWQYTAAANFLTATGGQLASVGTGGIITDLVANRLVAAAVAATAEVSEHTFRIIGAVSPAATFAHEADSRIRFTLTALPSSGGVEVRFRKQSSSNYLAAVCNASGNFILYEVIAGSYNNRGSAAGVLHNGDAIEIVCDGTTITGYYAGTQAWQYTAAENFQMATAGQVFLGTGGAVADLVSYPYPSNASTLETEYRWHDFEFNAPLALSADTPYWVRLETTDAADGGNYVLWGADGITLDYDDGEMKYRASSGWQQESKDAIFEVYAA